MKCLDKVKKKLAVLAHQQQQWNARTHAAYSTTSLPPQDSLYHIIHTSSEGLSCDCLPVLGLWMAKWLGGIRHLQKHSHVSILRLKKEK